MNKLLYYSAPSCGPCRALAPIVEEVKAELGDLVTIEKIDASALSVDELKAAKVKSVPTLVLMQNDQEVRRHLGLLSKQGLLNFINAD